MLWTHQRRCNLYGSISRRVKILMVLGEGLEPSRLTAPEPKSGVSANFTTRALIDK